MKKKPAARLREGSALVPKTGCWEWSGHKQNYGYGRMWAYGKSRLAHRVSWTAFVGPIPDGLCVLHRCDTPACVNPEHLFLGTHQDNMTDMANKGRASTGAQHAQAIERGRRIAAKIRKEPEYVK